MFLLFFMIFLLSCFPACLLSCFSTFLLVCFAVLLLQFVSAFVFACLCFAVLVLLSFLCRVVLHSMLTLACSVRVQFSPYQPAVVQRRSGSSMASLGQGVGSLVVLSVDMSYFPFNSIFSESVP